MYIGLHVKYPLFLSDFHETGIFSIAFLKKKIKFHENPPIGSRDVPCGREDRRRDTTTLIVAFRNFANAPKNPSAHNPKTILTELSRPFHVSLPKFWVNFPYPSNVADITYD